MRYRVCGALTISLIVLLLFGRHRGWFRVKLTNSALEKAFVINQNARVVELEETVAQQAKRIVDLEIELAELQKRLETSK